MVLGAFFFAKSGRTQTPPPQPASAAASAAIKQYCVGCHSAALKTGGVVLDPATLTQVSSNAETWERAIKQLRAKSMPPVPMPRPDAATYDRVASYLESELDRAATRTPVRTLRSRSAVPVAVAFCAHAACAPIT